MPQDNHEIIAHAPPHAIHCENGVCSIINLNDVPVSRDVPPCALIIFGATGDLAHRKLLPAVYDLAAQNLLPDEFTIIGYGRSQRAEKTFREELAVAVKEHARLPFDEEVWHRLEERIFYQRGAYDEAESFDKLDKRLDELDKKMATGGNRMYYLATPPTEFSSIIELLGGIEAKRQDTSTPATGWHRVIVEKPFGRDFETARDLNNMLGRYFFEDNIYRIDHYLGKETVQNILVLRFANAIFEPIWNNRYVDHVQIVVAEDIDVGRRGGYYESSGALRDMVVNHMLQLVALTTMEAPVALDANSIRDEKVSALRAIRQYGADEVLKNTLRGQYDGYLKTEGVEQDSRTETFVALKLWVDNWRWSGVPFYLRHGKALKSKATEIVVRWKDTPGVLFNNQSNRVKSNMLIMRIQPDEGFALRTNAKVPGSGTDIRDVQMDFDYHDTFGGEPPEAYERLLHDALLGDSTLFTRRDEAEVEWNICDPMLKAWPTASAPFPYQPGSWGPDEAHDFINTDGRRWHQPQVEEKAK